MRQIRNFLMFVRNGAISFAWYHPTAIETATFQPTSPVNVLLTHGMVSNMWVGVSNTPNGSINGGIFPITVTSVASFTLNGTNGAGAEGVGNVVIYVPRAVAVMAENTLPAPTTLIGPERIPVVSWDLFRGYYSFQVVIEELF